MALIGSNLSLRSPADQVISCLSLFAFIITCRNNRFIDIYVSSVTTLEVFAHPNEWEDQVNLPLLQRAWSYRGPPEQ